MERIGRRKKKSKSVWLLTLLLTVAALLFCLTAAWFAAQTGENPLEPLEGELPGSPDSVDSMDSADSLADEGSASGDFAYRISGEIYIRDGVGDILLENPGENSCAFSVTVVLAENDQVLAQTPLLSPGQHLLRTQFQNLPERPGYYAADALFQVYSLDGENLLGEYRCSIKLNIQQPTP